MHGTAEVAASGSTRSLLTARDSRGEGEPDRPRLAHVEGRARLVQGYNAQAAVNENQIVIAAEVTVDSPDFGHLQPMLDAAQSELQAAGVLEDVSYPP